jgi:hypothetical protein
LVGQPLDGTWYDLFAIIDVAERGSVYGSQRFHQDRCKTKGREVRTHFSVNLIKDVAYFKDNIGDDMVTKVKLMEALLVLGMPPKLRRYTRCW